MDPVSAALPPKSAKNLRCNSVVDIIWFHGHSLRLWDTSNEIVSLVMIITIIPGISGDNEWYYFGLIVLINIMLLSVFIVLIQA